MSFRSKIELENYMCNAKNLTIDIAIGIFQYKNLNNIIYLNKLFLKFKNASTPLCSFVNSKMRQLYTVFGNALNANPSEASLFILQRLILGI